MKGNKFALGIKHTQEYKDKISEKMKGNQHAKGHKLSEKHKEIIIKAHSGVKSHWWKDGRCKNLKYVSWIRNKRNRAIKRLRKESLSHTFGEWELLKKQYGYCCPHCGKSEPVIQLTEDHIIPLSKGGSDLIENIQPLCRNCNCKKGTKIL